MPVGIYTHKKGLQAPSWKGGKIRQGKYIAVYAPTHNRASIGNKTYVFEHVLLAEQALGRALPEEAEVHHVDYDGANNGPGNLVLCQDHAYHRLLHVRTEALKAKGNVNARRCSLCKEWEVDLVTGTINNRAFRHRACHAVYMRQLKKARVEELVNTKL